MIAEGSPDAVIQIVDALEKIWGKKYYSFSSKYCAMQNPKEFPIYDSIVTRLLKTILKHNIITDEIYSEKDLKDYKTYKNIYDLLLQHFEVECKHKYRGIDLYLWGGANETIQKDMNKTTQFMDIYNSLTNKTMK